MGTRDIAEKMLKQVDISINGNRPWDLKVHDLRFFRRVITGGSLALGEAYMDGWWDCDALDEFFFRILHGRLNEKVKFSPSYVWNFLVASVRNLQSKARAFQVGERHYDIGNALFQAMLDQRMVYSCGYWLSAENLDEAQKEKLDLICRKLNLKKGDRVLDIGCGWGSFCRYAAEAYGAEVVGVTVSRRQVEIARDRCKDLPVDIRLQDYRDLDEQFDYVVSIGMFEHVGQKNYRAFMEIVHKCLKQDGLHLLQCIGSNISVNMTDPWINKYIFPNGMIPSAQQIMKASEGLFMLEDWHNFGPDYDKTLMAWNRNFSKHWNQLREKYDNRFYRMWQYYLMISAASFRARKNQVWQIVLSKTGHTGQYYRSR